MRILRTFLDFFSHICLCIQANVLMRQKTPYRNELKEIKEVARKKHMEEKRVSQKMPPSSAYPNLGVNVDFMCTEQGNLATLRTCAESSC